MSVEAKSPVAESLAADGYAFVAGPTIAEALEPGGWRALASGWDDLMVDQELPGPLKYRARRYGRFLLRVDEPPLEALPHEPFVQSSGDIPAYGGRPRCFAPLKRTLSENKALHELIHFDARQFSTLRNDHSVWEVGVHMVRLTVAPGMSVSPTPEGRHRDGHSFIGMHLLAREGCMGGESSIYRPDGEHLATMTLVRPLDSVIVDDEAVEHAVSNVTAPLGGPTGRRDLLILAFYPPSSHEHGKAQP